MKELIKEYRLALREINKARMKAPEDDRKILSNCADSVTFAIEYMEKGREPGNRRAITRRSGLQREIPVDPQNVAFVRAAILERKTKDSLSEEQKEMLDDILGVLTSREKEAFVMVRGNGYSFGEAAELMGMKSRGAVQVLVERAERKIGFVVQLPPNSKNAYSMELSQPIKRVLF